MHHIALFDIDKTLIARSRAHLKAFFIALRQVYGVNAESSVMTQYGMTDQQIIREILARNGIPGAVINDNLPRCMQVMIDKFNELNREDSLELCPGVVELLTELEKRNALCGLVTGNLEPIAWAKLTKAGIARFFTFGGFGSDDEDRKKMAALALQRCRDLYNLHTSPCRIALFGDTPYDMAAAHAIGGRAVGVATGHPTREQLMTAGADVVLDDLSDMQAALLQVFDK
jgi:phosphoglycolate phosphatase